MVFYQGAFFLGMLLAVHDYYTKFDEGKINTGTNPPLIIDTDSDVPVLDRSDIVEEIVSSFIAAPDNEVGGFNPFGVVIGPTGTGKTQLIRQACRQKPKGVLYIEIDSTDIFVEKLAEAVGMRTKASLISLFVGKTFPEYMGYYELPEDDYPKAIGVVIKTLLDHALLFKEREGRPVCLFIDAADLLAKHKPEAFKKLVDIAKSHANSGSLRIVFGCSEGYVVPIIDGTSSKSRLKPIEVGDLSDDKAINYLEKCSMPEKLATQVVTFAGGRMIFLRRSVMTFRTCITTKKMINYTAIYEKIIKDLNVIFAYPGIHALVKGGDLAIDMMKHLKTDYHNGFYLHEYLETLSANNQSSEAEELIESLVKANAFRYADLHNKVAWHSRLMQNMARDFFGEKII